MTEKLQIPNVGTPLTDGDGRMSREWAKFFQVLVMRLNTLLS